MAHSAFMRSMELCRALPKVTDHQSFYELLTSFVARVKALTPGAVLVMPAGWKGGLVTLVLHCASFDSFTLAVCSVGESSLAVTNADEASTKTRTTPRSYCLFLNYCQHAQLIKNTLKMHFKMVNSQNYDIIN